MFVRAILPGEAEDLASEAGDERLGLVALGFEGGGGGGLLRVGFEGAKMVVDCLDARAGFGGEVGEGVVGLLAVGRAGGEDFVVEG